MIKTLQNTLKQDKEGFVLPKSVQDAIPIRRLWPDGIFQFGSKFSKTIRFTDINYAIASKEDKTSMFLGCSELLNALDMGSTTKITINNKRLNRQNFEQEILIPRRDDYLDGCRAELARLLYISDNQLSYITNVDFGRGLIKCGSTIVPFMNVFPKNTRLYKLMSTKFMEQIDVT